MTRITREDIERARSEAATAEENRTKFRVHVSDVERSTKKRILGRVKPLNFHHGMNVGARTMAFLFNAPRGEFKYELHANGRRYPATRKNEITIFFENVPLVDGLNVLDLTIPGHAGVSRQFTVNYDFEEVPYYGRLDPVTQREFAAGDIVVRCRHCLQYALCSSWRSANGPCPYSTLPNSRCQNHDQGFFDTSDPGFSVEAR